MRDHLTSATIYCDAAFVGRSAGYGVLARLGDRMIARSRVFRFEIPTSGMAEAHAMFCALQVCRDMMPEMTRATINLDCLAVVEAMHGRRRMNGIWGILQEVDSYAHDEGIELSVHWVKGHNVKGARGVANGVAHRLAWLGRHRDEVDHVLPFGIDWQRTLSDRDPRLVHISGENNVPFEQVTRILGVGPDIVANLLKHGHLDYDHTGVTLHSLNRVVSEVIRMRAEQRQLRHQDVGAPAMA